MQSSPGSSAPEPRKGKNAAPKNPYSIEEILREEREGGRGGRSSPPPLKIASEDAALKSMKRKATEDTRPLQGPSSNGSAKRSHKAAGGGGGGLSGETNLGGPEEEEEGGKDEERRFKVEECSSDEDEEVRKNEGEVTMKEEQAD